MHLPFALETKQRILHTGDLLGDNSLAPKSHGRTALMESLTAKRVPVCNHAIFKKFLTWKPVRSTILLPLSQSAMGTISCFPRASRPPTVFFNPARRFSDTIFQILWAPSYHSLSLFLPSMFGDSRRTNTGSRLKSGNYCSTSGKSGSRARRVEGSDIGTMDPNGMVSKAREWVERLRGLGVRRKEIKEIEGLLREGKVGEAYIKSGTLITIVEEMRPDALARKLVDISRRGERCLFDILEISLDLADIEVWKQHLTPQRDFDAFCQTVLKITPRRARAIIALSDSFSFAPEGLGPSEVLNALVDVAKTLSSEDE